MVSFNKKHADSILKVAVLDSDTFSNDLLGGLLSLCCRVLQGVAGCCRVLQGVSGCCRVLQGVYGYCRVLQCVAVCCTSSSYLKYSLLAILCCSVLQRVAACCCSVLPICSFDAIVHMCHTHKFVMSHIQMRRVIPFLGGNASLCDTIHLHGRRDSFIYVRHDFIINVRPHSMIHVTRCIHTWHTTHLYRLHHTFARGSWSIDICDMMHSHVRQRSFVCLTRLTHGLDVFVPDFWIWKRPYISSGIGYKGRRCIHFCTYIVRYQTIRM